MSRTRDNNFRSARDLGRVRRRGKNASGRVSRRDRVDFFEFELTANRSRFTLRSQRRLDAPMVVRLFDENRDQVKRIRFRQGRNGRVLRDRLEAGTYFVQVQGQRNGSRYRLRLAANPIRPPRPTDDTLTGARNLGAITSTTTTSGFVGTTDAIDFYRFQLPQNGNMEFRFTGADASVSVDLIFDANANNRIDTGEVIDGDSGTSDTFLEALPAGLYYLRVQPSFSSSSTNYGLTLVSTLQPGNISPEPGNTLATANNLGVLTGTRTLQDYVGAVDNIDYYQFTLSQDSDLQVDFTGTSASITTNLIFDANNNGLVDTGEIIDSDVDDVGSFFEPLPRGTYFLQVQSSRSTQYEVILVEDPSPIAAPNPETLLPEPGNTLGTATNLGVLSGTRIFNDYVGPVDGIDYYQFTLSQNSDLQVDITGNSGSLAVNVILDANNNGIVDNDEVIEGETTRFSGELSDGFIESLPSGSYFIEVQPRFDASTTRYELTLVETPKPGNVSPDPGNTLSQALDIGVISDTQVLNDYVGVIDDADFYRFTLSQATTLEVSLFGETGSLAADLFVDTNNNGLIDNGEFIDGETTRFSSELSDSFSEPLAPGTYFIRMQPRFDESASNYTLTLVPTV